MSQPEGRVCRRVSNVGTVWGRGRNNYGQLGDGTFTDSTVFVQAQGLTIVVQISGGYSYIVARKSDGTVWVWGWNFWGELGNGTQFIQQRAAAVARFN